MCVTECGVLDVAATGASGTRSVLALAIEDWWDWCGCTGGAAGGMPRRMEWLLVSWQVRSAVALAIEDWESGVARRIERPPWR